jgi:hypothetical protein
MRNLWGAAIAVLILLPCAAWAQASCTTLNSSTGQYWQTDQYGHPCVDATANGGGGGGGGGGAVTAISGAYVDGSIVTLGTEADSAWGGSGSATEIALNKAIWAKLNTINTTLGTPTQAGATQVVSGTIADSVTAATMVPQGGGTAAANAAQVAGVYSSTGLTLTSGQAAAVRLTSQGWLETADQNLAVAQGSTTAGQLGPLVQATALSSAASYTNGGSYPLTMNTAGGLRVTLQTLSGGSSYSLGATPGSFSSISGIATGGQFLSTPATLTNGQGVIAAVNTTGSFQIDTENLKASYSASGTFTPAATPTDVVTITGSASKTVRIKRIRVMGNGTSSGYMTMYLARRSTADTGQTSTAPTADQFDTNSAAPTAAVAQFSANATTLGTLVAYHDTSLLGFNPAASANALQVYERAFGTANTQSIVLRGTTQSVSLYFGGGAVPTGGVITYSIEWTEE